MKIRNHLLLPIDYLLFVIHSLKIVLVLVLEEKAEDDEDEKSFSLSGDSPP